jgi:hypothetical protein
MYLGLDLRGGVHFLLQVDMKGALTKRLDSTSADLRTVLRDKNMRHGGVNREGDRIVIKFRDADTQNKARIAIADSQPTCSWSRPATPATKLIATLKPLAQKKISEFALKQNITTLHNRINELGVAEPVIQQQGQDRIVVQLPGVQDTAKAKDILGRTATSKSAWWTTRRRTRSRPGGNPPFGTELYRARRPAAAGQEAGRPHRRPPHRRPARLRRPDPGAGRAPDARCRRRPHLQGRHPREHQQAHGHPAHREGQGRGRHRPGHPQRDRRRPRADFRPHDHGRPTTPPCCCAPVRWPRRWTSSRNAPSARPRRREHQKGFHSTMWGFAAIASS